MTSEYDLHTQGAPIPEGLRQPVQDEREAFNQYWFAGGAGKWADEGAARTAWAAWQARAAFAQAHATPPGWKFRVMHSDDRVWLNITTPHGATAALSGRAKTGNGDATIVAQVLDYLDEAIKRQSQAPQPTISTTGRPSWLDGGAEAVAMAKEDGLLDDIAQAPATAGDGLPMAVEEFRQAFIIAVGDKSPFAKIALGKIDAAMAASNTRQNGSAS